MNVAEILALAALIKNETGIDKNTAIRIGSALEEIINYFRDNAGPGGGTSFVGEVITSAEQLDAQITPGVYPVQMAAAYEDFDTANFDVLVMPMGNGANNFVQISFVFSQADEFSVKARWCAYAPPVLNAPAWNDWKTNSGTGGGGAETDPFFAAWLATNPLSGFLTQEADPIFEAWLQNNPLANYALQQWVTDNFALKQSGVVPPVSEDILLTTAAPSYTVVPGTADNINVNSTAAAGTIVLTTLAAAKELKISIKTGSNAVTIAGTAYAAGVVVFAVYDEALDTWSVDSTLDPVIPDYSDIKVQKRVTTAPTQSGWTYIISGIPAGGGSKGHLIFIDIPGSAFSGVYSSLVNFAGTTTYAQKIIEGTALNVVRVGSGYVYHSEYDGANLASLKFNSIAEVNTAANFKTKLETLTADNRLSESAIKLATASYNGVNTISLDFSKEVNKITLDAAGTLAILIDTFTNVPLIDAQRTVLLKNNRASSVNISFKNTDLVVGDVTYSFTNLTLPVITVYASKVAEISYLLLFSSATACQVYITSVAQP